MPWDREDAAHALDDSRADIVGLSDDAGAAQNLAHAMKVAWAPIQSEVSVLSNNPTVYHGSLFPALPHTFYAPPSLNYCIYIVCRLPPRTIISCGR